MKLGTLTDLEPKFLGQRLAGLSDATGNAVTVTLDTDLLRDHEAQALEAIRLCYGAPEVKAFVITNSPPTTVNGQRCADTARLWVRESGCGGSGQLVPVGMNPSTATRLHGFTSTGGDSTAGQVLRRFQDDYDTITMINLVCVVETKSSHVEDVLSASPEQTRHMLQRANNEIVRLALAQEPTFHLMWGDPKLEWKQEPLKKLLEEFFEWETATGKSVAMVGVPNPSTQFPTHPMWPKWRNLRERPMGLNIVEDTQELFVEFLGP